MRTVGLVLGVVAILLTPSSALASHLPESDADALEILHDYYPGYWWDHTQLTVAVQTSPNVRPELRAAVHEAIATWDSVLRAEFDGLITLTDVTSQLTANHKADIVVHYVPRAGGVVFGGIALCGDHKCPNVIVRSDLPQGGGAGIVYSPSHLRNITLHELGHALGLGHATNLLESTDLMGYGGTRTNGIQPVLSDCDLDGIRYVFQWAFDGVAPYPQPANGPYDCSLD